MLEKLYRYNGFCFAVLFAFFEAVPLVMFEVYGFDLAEGGNCFLALGLGVVFSAITNIYFDKILFQPKRALCVQRGTIMPPEHRLYVAMAGSILLPISLFWFAWSAYKEIHWIVPGIGACLFGWGVVGTFVSSQNPFLVLYTNTSLAFSSHSPLFFFGFPKVLILLKF